MLFGGTYWYRARCPDILDNMRIVLSRKGLDSGNSSYPSPILPNGTLLSIPIPADQTSAIRYSDLLFDRSTRYSDLLNDLGIHKPTPTDYCHLDPDIRKNVLERSSNWRPLFGQVGASQTHLDANGVKEGDVFLFFGWFKKTVIENGKLRFDKKDKYGKHVIFGYLQVGSVVRLRNDQSIEKWMQYHHHIINKGSWNVNNTVYVSNNKLSWNRCLPGAGVFKFNDDLVLTKVGFSRTKWCLPDFFRGLEITYHNTSNWYPQYFKSASRGQEFIIEESEKIAEWTRSLINQAIVL